MAFKFSALEQLRSMRKNGQRPDGPVVIADNPMSTSWAVRNGFCAIDRRDLTDYEPLAGLDAIVLTIRPYADSLEMALELKEYARFVTLSDALHRNRSEFL